MERDLAGQESAEPRRARVRRTPGAATESSARPSPAAERAAPEREASEGDFAAGRLLERAADLFGAGETDRAVKMLETLLDQYPDSPVRFKAHLALGKHFIETHQQDKAIGFLRNLKVLEKDQEAGELPEEQQEVYIEGLYLTGIAYFQMRQFAAAFPILRKITNDHPNSVWANQAYYYIGMCHFAQQNWNKAIESLSRVGTFIDADSPSIQFAESGRRFYVKISDADLPVLERLGQEVSVRLRTRSGDQETFPCIPLVGGTEAFIGSIATEVGVAKPGDDVLQVIGGDAVQVEYVDDNTQEGKKGVLREHTVQMVSTASLTFTVGTYESSAAAAFQGQPLFVLLQDVDLDTGPESQTASVRIISRYKKQEEEGAPSTASGVDLERLFNEPQQYEVRDEVTVTLKELGAAPIHTGRFGGSSAIEPYRDDRPIDKSDQVLTCAVGDEVHATFMDERHIGGESARVSGVQIAVAGQIDSVPRATQNVVFDPVLKAKKGLVEASAFLELARIFRSMGLHKGAKEKADEGLGRVIEMLRPNLPLPASLREEAFRLKWELHIVQEDFPAAIATCQLFNRLFPESPFVDQALMGIGKIRMENKQYNESMNLYRQVLALPNSQAKAEAQFRIAECLDAIEEQRIAAVIAQGRETERSDRAIQEYKTCAQRFPESQFAGQSLAKVADYYIEKKDYAQADDLLDQVFQDYPDAEFLDGMLLKWVVVSYRTGNYQKAYEKCSQLVFEYPGSPFAEKAKQVMPEIEKRVKP